MQLDFVVGVVGPKFSRGPRGEEHYVHRNEDGTLWTKSSMPLSLKAHREMRTAEVLREALNAIERRLVYDRAEHSDESVNPEADAFLRRLDGSGFLPVQVGVADTSQDRWKYYAEVPPGHFVCEDCVSEEEYARRIIEAAWHKESAYPASTKANMVLALDAAAVPEAIDERVRDLVRSEVSQSDYLAIWVCGFHASDAWRVC